MSECRYCGGVLQPGQTCRGCGNPGQVQDGWPFGHSPIPRDWLKWHYPMLCDILDDTKDSPVTAGDLIGLADGNGAALCPPELALELRRHYDCGHIVYLPSRCLPSPVDFARTIWHAEPPLESTMSEPRRALRDRGRQQRAEYAAEHGWSITGDTSTVTITPRPPLQPLGYAVK